MELIENYSIFITPEGSTPPLPSPPLPLNWSRKEFSGRMLIVSE